LAALRAFARNPLPMTFMTTALKPCAHVVYHMREHWFIVPRIPDSESAAVCAAAATG
jgi:hypothetical protein